MKELYEKNIIFSEEAIRIRVAELGKQISIDYKDKELILVSVLKGSFYFLADLSRAIDLPLQLDFIAIGTYPNVTDHTGIVRIIKDLDLNITGKHLLVIEDVIRTGLTTGYLIKTLEARKPASIKVCSFLVNPNQQLINVPVAYSGFHVPTTRLIGYGLDVSEKYRNLPYIAEQPLE